MKAKEFFGKFCSLYLWGNLLAMALVVTTLCFGVKYGLEAYTHHGEGIKVPQLMKMRVNNAQLLLIEMGLNLVVNDSAYDKRLPAGCILSQMPGPGMQVKAGRVVYATINTPHSPSLPIPDLIENSSYREAEAKLRALGFTLLPPKLVLGERDWVYGIMSRGRQLSTGDMVSTDYPLTLLIGNGQYGEADGIDYTDIDEDGGSEDDFDEVMPPTTTDDNGMSDVTYGE